MNASQKPAATQTPIQLSQHMLQGQIRFTLAIGHKTPPEGRSYLIDQVRQFRNKFAIEERSRMDDDQRNSRQQRMVQLINLALPRPDQDLIAAAQEDRYREGHVDTGTLCYDRDDTQCAIVRSGLRRAGYGLTEIFGEYRPNPMAYTVVCTYRRLKEGEESIVVPTKCQDALRHIASAMNWTFFGYDNLDIEAWARQNLPADIDPYRADLSELSNRLKDKVIPRDQMPRNFTLNFTWPVPLQRNPFMHAVRISKQSIVTMPLEMSAQAEGVSEAQEANVWEATPDELKV